MENQFFKIAFREPIVNRIPQNIMRIKWSTYGRKLRKKEKNTSDRILRWR